MRIGLMSAKKKNDLRLYCEACRLVFRIAGKDLDIAVRIVSVACPICGRQARIEAISGGGIQILDGDHVIVCPGPLNRNPLTATLVYVSAAVMVAAILGVIAKQLGPFLCPVVFITSLLLIGVVGAIQLTMTGVLTGSNFLQLMAIFYKHVPLLMGKEPAVGQVNAKSAKAAAKPH